MRSTLSLSALVLLAACSSAQTVPDDPRLAALEEVHPGGRVPNFNSIDASAEAAPAMPVRTVAYATPAEPSSSVEQMAAIGAPAREPFADLAPAASKKAKKHASVKSRSRKVSRRGRR